MKVKSKIACPYCDKKARPLWGTLAENRMCFVMRRPRLGWTRYGCDNRHYFAVPNHQVEIRERIAA